MNVMPFQAVLVMFLAMAAAASSADAADMKVEFRAGGRCTLWEQDRSAVSSDLEDLAQPDVPASEYRCTIPPHLRRHPIELSVILPQGEAPAGADFPRLAWAERDGRWVGAASLPAAPAFVRVPLRGSTADRRGRVLDWASLAATALAIVWTIKYSGRN